jgi:hypothetical protein
MNTLIDSTTRAACTECGYIGSLYALSLHSCDIQNAGGRCEDYPCCGHTDGDGCQTLPEHTSAYWLNSPHLGCDHEAGICDAYDYDCCPDCGSDETCDEHDECWGCCAECNGTA